MAATIHALETLAFDDNPGFIEPLNSIVERGFAEMRAAGMLIKEQRVQGAALAQSPNKRNLRRQLRGFLQTIVSQAMESGLVRQDFDLRRLTEVRHFVGLSAGRAERHPHPGRRGCAQRFPDLPVSGVERTGR